MKVIRATAMGMCFGVEDALDLAMDQRDPRSITIHGDLVHNETVLDRLRQKGFAMQREQHRDVLPPTPRVLITAHGVSEARRRELAHAGRELIDTTCPLVRHVHRSALALQRAGYHILVLGKPGHVEVEGIVGDLQHYHVVPDESAVCTWPYDRLGVVCQSTFLEAKAMRLLQSIEDHNPHAEVKYVDTICEPTKQRVRAVRELCAEVAVVVVVGGRTSNNTRQLVQMCRDLCCEAFHVQGPADLQPAWFQDVEVVGLTAGTSTPGETIDAVEKALRNMRPLPTQPLSAPRPQGTRDTGHD